MYFQENVKIANNHVKIVLEVIVMIVLHVLIHYSFKIVNVNMNAIKELVYISLLFCILTKI